MSDPGDSRSWAAPDLPENLAGGVIHDILTFPDPVLRENCASAGYLTGTELIQLAADLLATMYASGGCGLAAPQIGVMRRIFVMDAGWKDGESRPIVMLDPEILAVSDARSPMREDCLSFPVEEIESLRPDHIEIAWYDLIGLYHRETLSHRAAGIAQHQTDHLDGRLIIDL
ncbi:peptide deformylase [Paracoccus fistulariae]|uniref:Peptide deformylase-like n=1 Tax=Paracoccus fistulariae TaxID=658446 RepID=A0ABY7SI04_9RHOB|nr:peptide deformylase [Paracoccus fistulariae]MDB6182123.1 peptide deformylase [Paracoccus fistulariae]WCR06650.1 peptide deformylase [Paracoccus fistulariae]